MKRLLMLVFLFAAIVTACDDVMREPIINNEAPSIDVEGVINFEQLAYLDNIPHEMGEAMTLIQDEQGYETWAQMFGMTNIPQVDFQTEDVLFVTAYSNGCGLIIDTLQQQGDVLVVTLNYPKQLQQQEDLVCTEILLTHAFVVKIAKTSVTKGTLKNPERVVLEQIGILP